MATVNGTAGQDFIHRSGDGLVAPLGYNDVVGVTTGSDTIIGGDGDDIIYGDAGNDFITGGLGTDQLFGGDGIDTFVISDSAQVNGLSEIMDGGNGTDDRLNYTGSGSLLDLTNSSIINVERLQLLSSSTDLKVILNPDQISGFSKFIIGTGEPIELLLATSGTVILNSVIILNIGQFSGSDGNDIFEVGGTIDDFTISGGMGNDSIFLSGIGDEIRTTHYVLDGGEGRDVLKSKDGLNTMFGGDGRDKITGGKRSDIILGGDGDDKINGGGKQDTLTGGAGGDRFILSQSKDSGPTAESRDTITDFSQAEGDRIDLSKIDGNTTLDGDQAFFIGGSTFTNTAGEIIQFSDGQGNIIIAGDSDGDGIAEFEIFLTASSVLTSSDFFL